VSADDPSEQLFARGVTDGLPVVPPTRERVEATIAASGFRADDLIARWWHRPLGARPSSGSR